MKRSYNNWFLISLSTSSIIYVIFGPVTIDLLFFFIVGHIFFILCVSAYFLLELYIVKLLDIIVYIPMNILKDSIKLPGNSLILLYFAFKLY